MPEFYMESSFVIATLISMKNKYLNLPFVTYQELNYFKNLFQNKFIEEGQRVLITDEIDELFFKTDDVILLNKENDITLDSIESRYQDYCPGNLYHILWNDENIFNEYATFNKNELTAIIENMGAKNKK